jgi:hypothetical protein
VLLTAVIIDRVARHCLVSYGLLLGGVSCLAAASGVSQLAQCLLAAGKFGCTGEASLLPLHVVRLQSTVSTLTVLPGWRQLGQLDCY